jgi:long chain fatty acid CoA FadD26
MPSPGGTTAGQPSPETTLTDLLRARAAQSAHRRAFTFVEFPQLRAPGRHRTVTWQQLQARAESVAALVGAMAKPGDRVALLMPQSLDYVAGFLGCLAARVIAVPLFSPDLPGHESRVAAVLEDCEPACALVNPASMRAAEAFTRASGGRELPLLLVGDEGAPAAAVDSRPASAPDEIAYLQYTSGSTRIPAGVMISHRNVLTNARQALDAFTGGDYTQKTSVGWLPLFHDMGLLLSIAAPLFGGFPSVLMDPIAFLERPERWLWLIGRYSGVLSAAPNFAYDYCVSRTDPAGLAGLRLDRVRALINGSEPVRPATLRRFQRAFAGAGLRPKAMCPSYGLAEATVFVATDRPTRPPQELLCRRDGLADGRIVPAGPFHDVFAPNRDGRVSGEGSDTVVALTACGSAFGQELRIIDPDSGAELPEGVVGEIAVHGPNVGLGYWKRQEQSAEVFGAQFEGDGRSWLRTGDLGALYEGRLLVTGRLKDLLIVDGRNHYPQDIEQTVQDALDCVRRDRIAVFAAPGDEGETVTAVAEHSRDLIPDDAVRLDADRVARLRVSTAHGLRLDRLVLVPPGAVPRTSSGKVSRSACRDAFLRGDYERYAAPLVAAGPVREAGR